LRKGTKKREEAQSAAQSFVPVHSAKMTAAIFGPLKMIFFAMRNDIFWKKL
jgi:hypothetical protein